MILSSTEAFVRESFFQNFLVDMEGSPEKSFSAPMMLGKQRSARVYKAGQKTTHYNLSRPTQVCMPMVATFQDRFCWADDGWGRLKGTMKDRLIRNLLMLVSTSTFTGMGCMEVILFILVKFVNKKLAKPIPFVPVLSCCDTDRHTPAVLGAFQKDARPFHVHRDITDRWSSELWEEVEGLKPSPSDYIEAKRMRMQLIEGVIMKHYDQSPSTMMSAPCAFHDGCCCSICDGDYSRYIGGHWKSLTEIRMNSAGIPCDDITTFGAREGDGGQTAEVHAAWAAERRALGEHIVMTECSVGWNADHLTTRLKDTHDCSTVIVRSGDTGDIVDRARKVAVCLNNHKACVLCVSCVRSAVGCECVMLM